MYSLWFMFGCKLPLNLSVQLHTDAIPLGNPNRLVHNDSSSSRSSLGSITSCLTKAEQNKCTERAWYRKAVYSALRVEFALDLCYVPNLTAEIVISFSLNRLSNFITIIIVIRPNDECFSFLELHFKPVSSPLEDQRYKTSSKADNQISNLLCIGFDLFRRLHVLFLPKLFNNFGC